MSLRVSAVALALLLSAVVSGACQCSPQSGNNTQTSLTPEGEVCEVDEECATGRCAALAGQKSVCRRSCEAGCVKGEVCSTLAVGASGQLRSACFPEREGLCLPCAGDLDCPYPADACLTVAGAKVCGRDCAFDGKCPDGYVCSQGADVDGRPVARQCQPRSGTCSCLPATTGQKRPCQIKNGFGTCVGSETCDGLKGYTGCDTQVPAAELCNGKDDDCNGTIDDGIAAIECGVGECHSKVDGCTAGVAGVCTPLPVQNELCNGKDDDCNGKVDEIFDFDSDLQNCGGCGKVCTIAHGKPSCVSKACRVALCDPDYADCNEDPRDGCEVDLRVDTNHCGSCTRVCAAAYANSACASQKCAISSCLPGHYDVNRDLRDGCEYACVPTAGGIEKCDGIDNDCNGTIDDGFDLSSDPQHCGNCGIACSAPRGVAGCSGRACTVASCDAGRADCNGVVSDGCETDTDTSLASCGSCGAACAPANAAGACVLGKCQVKSCAVGFADCNNDPRDGCETDTRNDPLSCAACGRKCTVTNATAACVNSKCAVGTCAAPYGDCDGDPLNGCEVDTSIEALHCGSCATPCPLRPGTIASCGGSTCSYACASTFQDCDGNAVNGCESNKLVDSDHCGSCSTSCPVPANALRACNGGVCGASCNAPYADCDGVPGNGCEIDTSADVNNCGACTNTCPSRANANKTCNGSCGYACKAPFLDCDGLASTGCETDGLTVQNCGVCGRACPARANAVAKCTAAGCGFTCAAGYQDCDSNAATGCESEAATDVKNCGGCGAQFVCAVRPHSTPSCLSGACGFVCDAGFADCNGFAGDGCEAELAKDPDHCGGCAATFACASKVNATRACVNSACSWTCVAPFAECVAGAGCVVNTADNAANCGGCGMACSTNHQTVGCQAGVCKGSCDTDFANCDGDTRTNGCEINIATDPSNCGFCALTCSSTNIATPTCANRLCNGACNPSFGDCDSNKLFNGCEVNVTSSVANCGGCGVACSPNNVQAVSCTASKCDGACSTGFLDCNNDKQLDGCEVNRNTDAKNCGACATKCVTGVPAPDATCQSGLCRAICGIKINELSVNGGGNSADKFVEFTNNCAAGTAAINVAGYKLQYRAATNFPGGADVVLTGSLSPGAFLVYGFTGFTGPKDGALSTSTLSANGGAVQLIDATGKPVDSVSYDNLSTANQFTETAPAPNPGTTSISRSATSVDTNSNQSDFRVTARTPGAANP